MKNEKTNALTCIIAFPDPQLTRKHGNNLPSSSSSFLSFLTNRPSECADIADRKWANWPISSIPVVTLKYEIRKRNKPVADPGFTIRGRQLSMGVISGYISIILCCTNYTILKHVVHSFRFSTDVNSQLPSFIPSFEAGRMTDSLPVDVPNLWNVFTIESNSVWFFNL